MPHCKLLVSKLFLVGGLLALTIPWPAIAQEAAPVVEIGRGTALDGDSFVLNDRVIQLLGVDAPELGQTCLVGKKRWRCGLEAGFVLQSLICCRDIECRIIPESELIAFDRGICVAQSRDLGEVMVQRGMAVAADDIGPGYTAAAAAARSARLGIWRGSFVPPDEWRRGVRLASLPDEIVAFCEIKGVTNERGQKVFLVPSHPDYSSVEIDAERGDQIFCSDDQARLAGWRSSPIRRGGGS